jgi:Nucleotidyl transferase AbiEii toxin, Type IV TA system
MRFDEEVIGFLRAAQLRGVRLLLVGGGAVNFHGYQRHSADIDLWIEPEPANFERLLAALRAIGLDVDALPPAVYRQQQNISIKISPDLDIELITRFDPGYTFAEAWSRCIPVDLAGEPVPMYRVLSYDDLIASKLRSARPKDLLDVQELKRRKT